MAKHAESTDWQKVDATAWMGEVVHTWAYLHPRANRRHPSVWMKRTIVDDWMQMDLTGAWRTIWRYSSRLMRKTALGVEAQFGDERLDWRHSADLMKVVVCDEDYLRVEGQGRRRSADLMKKVVVCDEVYLCVEGQGRRRLVDLMKRAAVGVVTLYGPGTSNLAQMACFDVEERDLPPVAQLVDSYGP